MGAGLKNVERYKLHECIKKAGRVETWKAIDTSLRRFVTIKLIHAAPVDDPVFLARFTHETKVLRALHHPSIVRIQDTRIAFPPELANPIGYIVMDYVDGPTLADELRRFAQTRQTPSVEDVVHLVKAVADALDYSQQKGITHGNIQPGNILLRKRLPLALGEPVLTCFGTAKLLGTRPGILCLWGGDLPLYLAPEQCRGKTADLKSDVYALGAILYELYTGAPPFLGESASEIMVQHTYTAPKPPILLNPAMPPFVSKLIMRCLEKDPEARFATASALAAALADVLLPSHEDVFSPALAAPRARSTSRAMHAASSYATRLAAMRSLVIPRLVPYAPASRVAEPAYSAAAPAHQTATWRAQGSLTEEAEPFVTTEPLEQFDENTQPLWQITTAMLAATAAGPSTRALAPLSRGTPAVRMPQGVARFSTTSRVALSIALLLAVVGSGLGFYFAHVGGRSSPALPVVGQVSFVQSSPMRDGAERVLVDLHGIPSPGGGKNYFGWILGDTRQSGQRWLSLGPLQVSNGGAHVLFAVGGQHGDLLSYASFFLITQESVQAKGLNPFLQPGAWRYYAELPQEPVASSSDHPSWLDHVRSLLVQTPQLASMGYNGSVASWLLYTMSEVFTWSSEAQNDRMDASLVRQRLNNMLYLLDGGCAQRNVPTGELTPTQKLIAGGVPFPLLQPCGKGPQPGQVGGAARVPGDYLDQINFHLAGIAHSAGISASTRSRIAEIQAALKTVKGWLGRLQQDAERLLRLNNSELRQQQAAMLISDVFILASNAYAGDLDTTTGAEQGGVVYICESIQQLATFNVSPYVA